MSATETDERSIPDLVGDLFRAVLGLVRSTARMFGFELREVRRRIGRCVALLVVSSVLGVVGLLLVCGAVALVAEQFLSVPLWAGLGVFGVVLGLVGAIGMRTALRRLGDADIAFPGTVAELGKDVDALTQPREEP